MIVEAATLMLAGLNQYLNAIDGSAVGSPDVGILGTPAQLSSIEVGPSLENQILLTLVNIEEEAALKNGPTVFQESSGVVVRNRPVHLNLVFLFSAHFDNYETAMTRLSQVVTYFQNTKRFEPALFPGVLPNLPPEAELSVTMELVTLSLEEVNHIWGMMGGQQLPFATYRARLVVVREDRPAAGGGDIRNIQVDMRDTAVAEVM